MPRSANPAATAYSGRQCISAGAHANSTGRVLRGDWRAMRASNSMVVTWVSKCSTSTEPPVRAHTRPIDTRTGRSTSSQVQSTPRESRLR